MQQTISLVSNSYSTGTPVLIDILIYTDCELLEPPFSLNKTCAIISLIKGMQVAKCWILDICSAVSYFTFSAYEVKKSYHCFGLYNPIFSDYLHILAIYYIDQNLSLLKVSEMLMCSIPQWHIYLP